jgi:hypothetical protein
MSNNHEIDNGMMSKQNLSRHVQDAVTRIEQRIAQLAEEKQGNPLSEYDRGLIDGQTKALRWAAEAPITHIAAAKLDFPTSDPGFKGAIYRDGEGGRLQLSEGPAATDDQTRYTESLLRASINWSI